jgi:hypothetical protein
VAVPLGYAGVVAGVDCEANDVDGVQRALSVVVQVGVVLLLLSTAVGN